MTTAAPESRPSISTALASVAMRPSERKRLAAMHDAGATRADRHGEALCLFSRVGAELARVLDGPSSTATGPRLRILRDPS